MTKKLLLDFEEEISYTIIGISSGLKDYRLMFFLNKLDSFDFKRVDPFHFKIKEQSFLYSLYVYIDKINLRNFYLISNKANSVKLIKEFKHFDYVLIMDGEIDEDYAMDLAKKIKSINGVLMASNVDEDHLNKVPNLRTEFDLHLDNVLKIL